MSNTLNMTKLTPAQQYEAIQRARMNAAQPTATFTRCRTANGVKEASKKSTFNPVLRVFVQSSLR